MDWIDWDWEYFDEDGWILAYDPEEDPEKENGHLVMELIEPESYILAVLLSAGFKELLRTQVKVAGKPG